DRGAGGFRALRGFLACPSAHPARAGAAAPRHRLAVPLGGGGGSARRGPARACRRALLPPLLAIVWLCRSAAVGRLLDEIPLGWLVYPQAFRVVMELILWQLFVAGALPAIMTFEGRNVDIVVGLTAPLIAWQCFARRAWARRAALWWNVAGIGILLNGVVHPELVR